VFVRVSVLQCVAVCCCVLLCVAVRRSVYRQGFLWMYVRVCVSVVHALSEKLRSTQSVLQRVAVSHSVLQCVAVRVVHTLSENPRSTQCVLQRVALSCGVLRCVAVCCSACGA